MAAPPPYDVKTASPSSYPLPSQSEKVPHQQPAQLIQQPQPPPPSFAQPRFLHIYVDGFTHRHLTIKDSDKSTPLYTIAQNSGSVFSSKPHMRICRATPDNETVGTADFHCWSRSVDLTVHGRSVSMGASGLFTRTHSFQSSIGPLQWEGDGIFSADLVLVNENKEWIAKFHNSAFSMGKEGKLEISNGNIARAFLDEVVVSGVAMVEQERRSKNGSG